MIYCADLTPTEFADDQKISMTINALHICTSDSWGGLEIYASTFVSQLKKAGVAVSVICKPGSKFEQVIRSNDIPVFHLPKHGKVNLSAIGAIKRLVQNDRFNVVHVHYHRDLAPASFALRKNKNCRLFFSLYMGGAKKKDWLHRLIYRRVDALFSSSQILNEKLPDLYPLPASKIHFLPYGRFVENYRRDETRRREIRAQWNISQNDIVVGTMVRIDPQKGPLDFVKSYALLPRELQQNLTYLIVGEPSRLTTAHTKDVSPYEPASEQYWNEIIQEIDRNKLQRKIIMAGFQSDLIGYLNAMDIFVFPSHNEMYSLAVLDAMGMQLPVIATRAGGNLEQVREDETGLFYRVGDSNDLAKTLTRYLQQPALGQQHGLAAREFMFREHDMAGTISRYRQFCENALVSGGA